ncbi:hypothetical protein KAR91_11755 [Candidatus Pacearchaeota archaeon]|nr:hypothetical protein [Candidatus Pacearchaeota archaeon]
MADDALDMFAPSEEEEKQMQDGSGPEMTAEEQMAADNQEKTEDPPEPEPITTTDPPAKEEPEAGKEKAGTEEEGKGGEKTPEAEGAKDTKTVPLAALHEAREEKKELKRLLDEANASNVTRDQTVEQLKQAVLAMKGATTAPQVPEKPTEPTVSFEEDPVEYLKQENQILKDRLDTTTATADENKETNEQLAMRQQFHQAVVASEGEFRKNEPDYNNAVGYLEKFAEKELREVYGKTDPAEINQLILLRSNQIAVDALQNGMNVGERVYAIAKQYGYQPSAAPAADGGGEPAPVKDEVEGLLESVAAGQAASKTLSTGGKTEEKITMEGLLALEGEEFETAWKAQFGQV